MQNLLIQHCATKQPVILIEQAEHDWAIEKLPGSHHPPLLGKVKTAGQSSGFRASLGGSPELQLKPWDSHLTVTRIKNPEEIICVFLIYGNIWSYKVLLINMS